MEFAAKGEAISIAEGQHFKPFMAQFLGGGQLCQKRTLPVA